MPRGRGRGGSYVHDNGNASTGNNMNSDNKHKTDSKNGGQNEGSGSRNSQFSRSESTSSSSGTFQPRRGATRGGRGGRGRGRGGVRGGGAASGARRRGRQNGVEGGADDLQSESIDTSSTSFFPSATSTTDLSSSSQEIQNSRPRNPGSRRGGKRGENSVKSRSGPQHQHHRQNHQHQQGSYGSRPCQAVRDIRRDLNAAASRGDIAGAEREFAALVAAGDMPQTVTMNILIKAYARGMQPERGLAVLVNMLQGFPEGYGAVPSESTFNTVVAGFADSGDLIRARQIIDMQLSYGFSIQNSCCALLRSLPVDQVLPYLQQGSASGALLINEKALNMALVALLETPCRPDLDNAINAVLIAKQHGISLSCKGCTLFLTAYKRAGRERDGVAFFENYLRQENASPDVKLFTMALSLMVTLDVPLMSRAESLVEQMEKDFRIVPDVMVFNNLIKGYGNVKPPQVDDAIGAFNRVMTMPDLEPTEYTFSAIANVLSSAGRVEEAEELVMGTMLSVGLEPAAIHFNILMKGYSKCRCRVTTGYCKCKICSCSDPDRALELLALMEARGLQCDVVTLQNIVEAFCSAAQVDKALSIIKGVMCNPANSPSLRPTINVFNMLMRGVCVKYYVPQSEGGDSGQNCGGRRVSFEDVKQNNVDAALADVDRILLEISKASLVPDEVTVNSILSIYCAFQLIEKAEELVSQQHMRPNIDKANLLMSYNILFYGYANFHIPNADEMRNNLALLDKIRKRLDELQALGIAPDTIALNTLVKLLADRDMPHEAEAMIDEVLARCKAVHEQQMHRFPTATPSLPPSSSLSSPLTSLSSSVAAAAASSSAPLAPPASLAAPPSDSMLSCQDAHQSASSNNTTAPNRTTLITIIQAYSRLNFKDDAQRVTKLAENTYKIPLPPSARSNT